MINRITIQFSIIRVVLLRFSMRDKTLAYKRINKIGLQLFAM